MNKGQHKNTSWLDLHVARKADGKADELNSPQEERRRGDERREEGGRERRGKGEGCIASTSVGMCYTHLVYLVHADILPSDPILQSLQQVDFIRFPEDSRHGAGLLATVVCKASRLVRTSRTVGAAPPPPLPPRFDPDTSSKRRKRSQLCLSTLSPILTSSLALRTAASVGTSNCMLRNHDRVSASELRMFPPTKPMSTSRLAPMSAPTSEELSCPPCHKHLAEKTAP